MKLKYIETSYKYLLGALREKILQVKWALESPFDLT